MRLQSAIFDMDGTLLDSMGMWRKLGPSMLRRLGVEPSAEDEISLRDKGIRQKAEYCKALYGLSQTEEEIMALGRVVVEEFYRNEVQAKPGVQEFLSLLKMEGVWMYIATATDRPLVEIALAKTGLRDYFKGMVTAAEAGSKEHPEIFERAMARLQSNKKDTVIFEDSLYAIRTAKAAGFRVAGVYDESAKADQEEIQRLADYYIRSYKEMYHQNTLDG
ncbi:MAG: HAD family phosphatase [Oscillibacter sp.]|nr:HAD family phosphatase [Oscillibacter sp.]